MRLLYLGDDDSYCARRLAEEARRRRIVLTILHPRARVLTTWKKAALADVLVVRTQSPRWISHALTLAGIYRAAGKRVIDADLARRPVIYSKLNDLLVLAKHGVPVPKTMLAPTNHKAFADAAPTLGFPLVVKGIHGAGGEQVFLARSYRETVNILKNDSPIRANRRIPQHREGAFMLQEFLPAEYDYRVLVLGYRALPMLLRRFPKRGDFRTNAKFASRLEALPMKEFQEIKKLAEHAAKILKREFTGVDIRFKHSRPFILEVNRQPEFETFEKTTGLNVAGAFLEYITTKND